jgi:hypothetical protein
MAFPFLRTKTAGKPQHSRRVQKIFKSDAKSSNGSLHRRIARQALKLRAKFPNRTAKFPIARSIFKLDGTIRI